MENKTFKNVVMNKDALKKLSDFLMNEYDLRPSQSRIMAFNVACFVEDKLRKTGDLKDE